MILVVAELEGSRYYYGPYPTQAHADLAIVEAERRKGDRCPALTTVLLQSNDAFLVGSGRVNYQH